MIQIFCSWSSLCSAPFTILKIKQIAEVFGKYHLQLLFRVLLNVCYIFSFIYTCLIYSFCVTFPIFLYHSSVLSFTENLWVIFVKHRWKKLLICRCVILHTHIFFFLFSKYFFNRIWSQCLVSKCYSLNFINWCKEEEYSEILKIFNMCK